MTIEFKVERRQSGQEWRPTIRIFDSLDEAQDHVEEWKEGPHDPKGLEEYRIVSRRITVTPWVEVTNDPIDRSKMTNAERNAEADRLTREGRLKVALASTKRDVTPMLKRRAPAPAEAATPRSD